LGQGWIKRRLNMSIAKKNIWDSKVSSMYIEDLIINHCRYNIGILKS